MLAYSSKRRWTQLLAVLSSSKEAVRLVREGVGDVIYPPHIRYKRHVQTYLGYKWRSDFLISGSDQKPSAHSSRISAVVSLMHDKMHYILHSNTFNSFARSCSAGTREVLGRFIGTLKGCLLRYMIRKPSFSAPVLNQRLLSHSNTLEPSGHSPAVKMIAIPPVACFAVLALATMAYSQPFSVNTPHLSALSDIMWWIAELGRPGTIFLGKARDVRWWAATRAVKWHPKVWCTTDMSADAQSQRCPGTTLGWWCQRTSLSDWSRIHGAGRLR